MNTGEGNDGDYTLAGGGDISLAQVAKTLEFFCIKMSWRSGGMDNGCLIASGMPEWMDEILLDLNRQCMQLLQQITLWEIKQRIFCQTKTSEHLS